MFQYYRKELLLIVGVGEWNAGEDFDYGYYDGSTTT